MVPIYRQNHKPGWMFRAGMVLYDALSLRKSVPRHRALGRKAVAVELGSLNPDGLSAGLRYYDGQVVFAERLVLETLMSAADAGAAVLTYATASITVDGGRAVGLTVHDELTGTDHDVRLGSGERGGPWVDQARRRLGLDRMIGGTKGTHIVVDPFPGAPDVAIYYEARSDNRAVLGDPVERPVPDRHHRRPVRRRPGRGGRQRGQDRLPAGRNQQPDPRGRVDDGVRAVRATRASGGCPTGPGSRAGTSRAAT